MLIQVKRGFVLIALLFVAATSWVVRQFGECGRGIVSVPPKTYQFLGKIWWHFSVMAAAVSGGHGIRGSLGGPRLSPDTLLINCLLAATSNPAEHRPKLSYVMMFVGLVQPLFGN